MDSASIVVYKFACMFEALKFAVVLFSSISTLVVTVAQTRLNKRSIDKVGGASNIVANTYHIWRGDQVSPTQDAASVGLNTLH